MSCASLAGATVASGKTLLDDDAQSVRLSAIYALMRVDAEAPAPLLRAHLDEDRHDDIFKAHVLRALALYAMRIAWP